MQEGSPRNNQVPSTGDEILAGHPLSTVWGDMLHEDTVGPSTTLTRQLDLIVDRFPSPTQGSQLKHAVCKTLITTGSVSAMKVWINGGSDSQHFQEWPETRNLTESKCRSTFMNLTAWGPNNKRGRLTVTRITGYEWHC